MIDFNLSYLVTSMIPNFMMRRDQPNMISCKVRTHLRQSEKLVDKLLVPEFFQFGKINIKRFANPYCINPTYDCF